MELNPSVQQAITPITLVFTDMVGSSAAKRAASLGGDSAHRDAAFLDAIQSRHLQLIRECVETHGGKEIMTIGDSFFLTFDDPRVALVCCAEIQMRLKAQPIMTAMGPLRLRIGIHCGTPKFFENSWHGTDVDTAARVESTASADQIIVSEQVRLLLGELPGIPLRPLGTFALKGVGDVVLWDADYDQHGPRKPQFVSKEQVHRSARLKLLWQGGSVFVALLLVLASWFFYRQRQHNLLTPKDKLVLAEPDNKTGEAIFDATLKQALTTQLEQSPLLQLVSNGELAADLLYLKQPPEQTITPTLARQLGQRQGFKAYIASSLVKSGAQYIYTTDAVNCATGSAFAHAEAKAADQAHVLAAIAAASNRLRRKLGESLATVEKLSTSYSEITTSSLEAFHVYSLGEVEQAKGSYAAALVFYQQAAALDPNFAMAYARQDAIYISQGQIAKATEMMAKAYPLRERTTLHERLYIAAEFAKTKGNIPGTLEAFKELLDAYPRDGRGLNNMGVLYERLGDERKAAQYFARTAEASPWSYAGPVNAALALLSVDDASAARRYLEAAAILANRTSTILLQNQAFYAFEMGDAGWHRYLDMPNHPSDRSTLDQVSSNINYLQGRFASARSDAERSAVDALAIRAPDNAGNALAFAARVEAEHGICSQAKLLARQALGDDTSIATLPDAAIALALCGQGAPELAALRRLTAAAPENTLLNAVYVPETEAAIALAQHRPEQVQELLASTHPYTLASVAPIIEARALLELQRPADALAALQPALKYRYAEFGLGQAPSYTMATLLSARAQSMMGNKVAATKAYERLLDLWQNADADLRPLVEAKRELAALNATFTMR